VSLGRALEALERENLVRPGEGDPGVYAFTHSLIQEAAYSALLRRDRTRIHRFVGEALEREHAGSEGSVAPVLALHFEAAGDDERALRYRVVAGEAALRMYATAEAVEHFSRGLEIARRSPTAAPQEIERLYASRGKALELASRLGEALDNYEEMEREGAARNAGPLVLAGRMARASIYAGSSERHDAVQAERLCSEALLTASQLKDPRAEARILWSLGTLCGFTGRQVEAVSFGERSLAIARQNGLIEQEAFVLTDIHRPYAALGRYAESWSALATAQSIWRAARNLPMLADTLASSVLSEFLQGNYDRAIACAREAQEISGQIQNVWGQSYSRMWVGQVYLERGDVGSAIATWDECLRLSAQAGFPGPLVVTRVDQALLEYDLGRAAEGLVLAEEALAAAERYFPVYRPSPLLALAKLRALGGDKPGAERALGEAAQALRAQDPAAGLLASRLPVVSAELALLWNDSPAALRHAGDAERLDARGIRAPLPTLLLARGQALRALGDLDGARHTLGRARGVADAIGSRWCLWRVMLAQAEVADAGSERGEAARLRSEARGVVEAIAAKIGDAGRRQAFLARAMP
jgi:tetratricopeptide (TPR) repeat protein